MNAWLRAVLVVGWIATGGITAALGQSAAPASLNAKPPDGAPTGGPGTADPATDAGAEPGSPLPGEADSPEASFPYSMAPFENLTVESRLDSLRVTYGHGLPPEVVPVEGSDEGPYLALGDLGRITGGSYRWNPETWRGSFVVDSVDVVFTLDSPLFWVRGAAVQLPAPVRYRAEQVRVPLGVIDGILEPLLGERCRWDPRGGTLELTGPPPWVQTLALSGGTPLAALEIGPVDPTAVRLRWDPLGTLIVDVTGARAAPAANPVKGRAGGIRVARPRSTVRGFEVALALESEWVGARLRRDKADRTVTVELTTSTREVQRGRFEPLTTWISGRSVAAPGVVTGRTILLEIPPPPAAAEAVSDCLTGLTELLRAVLEQEFGHSLVVIQDRLEEGSLRSPAGLPETPGVPSGDCWIGVRLESRPPGNEGEFTLVVPGMVARREVLRGGALEAVDAAAAERTLETAAATGGVFEKLPPWGQTARPREGESARLARLIADHLDYRWADRPIRIHARPARIFRGLGVPGVILYPAAIDDDAALRALCDQTEVGELVRNLAFAIDEFLLGQAGLEE